MSRCVLCKVKSERKCSHEHLTEEFYNAIIAALKFVAEKCGYALAIHGSLKTDIDLIACPWRNHGASATHLAEEIRLTAERIIGTARQREGCPEVKPCGRLAWSFYLYPEAIDDGPYIDLSVMPVGTTPSE